jgi:hypothetical protein
LIESRLPESGEKPFAELAREVIKAAMKARHAVTGGQSFVCAARNDLLDEIKIISTRTTIRQSGPNPGGPKSGKAKPSRESGGFLPWTEADAAQLGNCAVPTRIHEAKKPAMGFAKRGRGRGLRRLHGEPDDGDVRLDCPEYAGA